MGVHEKKQIQTHNITGAQFTAYDARGGSGLSAVALAFNDAADAAVFPGVVRRTGGVAADSTALAAPSRAADRVTARASAFDASHTCIVNLQRVMVRRKVASVLAGEVDTDDAFRRMIGHTLETMGWDHRSWSHRAFSKTRSIKHFYRLSQVVKKDGGVTGMRGDRAATTAAGSTGTGKAPRLERQYFCHHHDKKSSNKQIRRK